MAQFGRRWSAWSSDWEDAAVSAAGRPGLGGVVVDGRVVVVKVLGLGEHGQVSVVREGSAYMAYVRYREFSGRMRRLKRSGRSKAEASRRVLRAVTVALGQDGDDQFTATSLFSEAAAAWLLMFEGLVARGVRSPSTLDEYRHIVKRVIDPGVGALRLGEVSTPRLDRFVQLVLVERGYATAKLTRSVLSGVCGWLVRRGAMAVNPVRELTPLELDRDRTARALSLVEVQKWLAVLDADEVAMRHDLPELARFMLATGLRLGEALGVTWADVDLAAGTLKVQRTIIRAQGKGLVAGEVAGVRAGAAASAVVRRAAAGSTGANGRLRGSGLP